MTEQLTPEGVFASLDPLIGLNNYEAGLEFLRGLHSDSLKEFYDTINRYRDLTARVIIERGGVPYGN